MQIDYDPEADAMTRITRVVITRLRICGCVTWTLPMRVTPREIETTGRERVAQERCVSLNVIPVIGKLDSHSSPRLPLSLSHYACEEELRWTTGSLLFHWPWRSPWRS